MYDIKKLHEAGSVGQAIQLLADHPEARVLAGGSDLLIKLRDGKLGDLELVSIQGVDELRQIAVGDDGTLRVGSLCSFSQVAESHLVRKSVNSLPEALLTIGGPQVRNIGTIGGNVCNGVTSADSASTCFAWDAELELVGPQGTRQVAITDFYLGAGVVDLRPAELLTAIVFAPQAYQGYKGAYIKYAMRNALDIATVNCATSVRLSEDRRTLLDARIAFGVAGPTPRRAPHGEAVLNSQPVGLGLVDAAARAALEDTSARDSWRAAKAFREHLLQELTRRCLIKSIKRAGGEL